MSLLKLLEVGRSFGGVREGTGRYRMTPDCRLPGFSPAPSVPEGITFLRLKEVFRRAPTVLGSLFVRPVKWIRRGVENWGINAAVRKKGLSGILSLPVGQGTPPLRMGNDLATSVSTDRSSGEQTELRPVITSSKNQHETSLEQVRVMRNDLNDSDVELWKSARNVATASTSEGAHRSRTTTIPRQKVAWSRLTAKLFTVSSSKIQ